MVSEWALFDLYKVVPVQCFIKDLILLVVRLSLAHLVSSQLYLETFDLELSFLGFIRVGLDLVKGTVRDNNKAGVLEPSVSKTQCLKFATEAAITILRIDDMVTIEPEKKEDHHRGMPH